MPGMRGTLEERFWPKVARGSKRECWLWTAHTNGVGYGMMTSRIGKQLAHRISWQLHFGPIPIGKLVLHRCDNPSCVNPTHLFIGDYGENVHDMHRKGRGRAKLAPKDIQEIKRLRKSGVGTSRLVAMFGVERSTIKRAVNGSSWGCLR